MESESANTRVVIDTNILVASAYSERSASRKIVEACIDGKLTACVSVALKKEWDFILRRAVKKPGYESRLLAFLDKVEAIDPTDVRRVVPDDADDDKIVAVALAANAAAIITNDKHLLVLDPFEGIRIVRPGEFVTSWFRNDS